MRNLLLTRPSLEELTIIFQNHPSPAPVLPACGDPRWAQALSHPQLAPLKETILQRARAEHDLPLPPLNDSLYRDFATTGTRLRFESAYFERRRSFARAAIALLATDTQPENALVQSFLDKLNNLMAESSWALPAHIKDPSGQDPQVIDLFAAETGNLMAETLSTFGTYIPEDLQTRIRQRLHKGIFENYLSSTFFWMSISNNWNAVCHQGVIGAALTVETDPARLAALCEKASRNLQHFLQGFGEDGACSEGPSYWEYGFGWFAFLNEQLETRTRGQLSLFQGNPLIEKIAGYGPAMTLQSGTTIPFSDSKPDHRIRPSLLQYLGRRLNHTGCLDLAHRNYTDFASAPPNCDSQRDDFFYFSRLYLEAPENLTARSSTAPKPANTYYPSLGIWIVRAHDPKGHLWELAAKGGHNDEHHNHNDVGNFVLTIDGIPLITEIGRPEYVADFFSDQRYTFFSANSLGHSLPLIHGTGQAAGSSFAGTLIQADITSATPSFEIDLTRTYPTEAHCTRYIRRLQFDPAHCRITLSDNIQLSQPGPIECGLITDSSSDVTISSPTLAHIRKAELTLALHAQGEGSWLRIESHKDRAPNARPRITHRLVLASDKTSSLKATVDITRH